MTLHKHDTSSAVSARALGLVAGVAIVATLLTVRVATAQLPTQELSDTVKDFFTLSISVFIESLPFVFLGVVLSVFVQVWVPTKVFDRLLPRTPVLRRVAMSLLGVFLPVCECGNVPLSRGLIIRGLTVSESLTFLMAAPILNPVTIITTYQAFGWDHGILLGRIIGGFVIANLIGWFFSLFLPTSVGGDAVRAVAVSRSSNRTGAVL
ncbi:MAG TPA: permease, partial [Terrimesophilobacter sp.]|nr:permease [Terrimesophilobacter sp.]